MNSEPLILEIKKWRLPSFGSFLLVLIKNKYIKAETDETHFPGFQIQHLPLHRDASLGGKANSEASESGHTEHKRYQKGPFWHHQGASLLA